MRSISRFGIFAALAAIVFALSACGQRPGIADAPKTPTAVRGTPPAKLPQGSVNPSERENERLVDSFILPA
ncbi:hypothetical protein [Cohnella candidum]|uniref:hypothetical protein n=1 Tax=Cohnella candidum TaxID=2674991 RepID=UPI0013DE3661|nr:hypothetical protein [Cohnella candidum]